MPPPPRTRLRGRLWSPVVFYCALIFGLSSLSSVPSMSGGSDKLAHTLLYAGLGWLLARAASGGGVRPPSAFTVFVVVGFAAAYGLSDEIHQMFVPLRHFDPRDLAADVVGAGAGAGAWRLWGILRRTRDVV